MAEYDPIASLAYDANSTENENDPTQLPEDDGEDDDYDPSSFNFQQGEDAQPSQARRPKMIGGFVVDSDDEDEQETVQQIPTARLGGAEKSQSGHDETAAIKTDLDNPSILHSEPQEDAAPVPSASQIAQNAHLNGSIPTVSALSKTLSPKPSPMHPFVKVESDLEFITPEQNRDVQPVNVASQPSFGDSSVAVDKLNTSAGIFQRLPHDKVGQLEDRIKEDPKADVSAWRSLILHYREKDQIDNARKVYWRFLEVFPSSTSTWYEFAKMELEHENMQRVEEIFGICLTQYPSVETWNLYLDYLRRIHPLISDVDGSKRGIIASAFEVVLDHVGIDPDSGKLWREYVDFVKSGPGTAGGTGWQDQQKMDLMRKAYQRAVRLPHSEYAKLWKEYDAFELTVNRATARQNLMTQSPHYMTARQARLQLEQRLDGLDRKSLPVLPPLKACAGRAEFDYQLQKYRAWIDWEKDDPLVLKDEDIAEYRKRIVYVYKQAVMHLRFYPEMWFEAATWCAEQDTEEMTRQGDNFLDQGITACPESVLLALLTADRVENGLEAGNSDEVAIRNGEKLDVPYETVLTALYALMKVMQERLKSAVEEVQNYFASLPSEDENEGQDADDVNADEDSDNEKPKSRAEQQKERVEETQQLHGSRIDVLKRTISHAWVAKMRAFRRIQGQGAPQKPRKGFRGVFAEARPRGQLSSDVYTASALMEWRCYKDPSASKIFERGLKLFPMDEGFALTYIKFLMSRNDDVNARAVFETTITKIIQAASLSLEKKREKCAGLLDYMHKYESAYGDLAHIQRLEKRRKELFPDESALSVYAHRFKDRGFNLVEAQLVISPSQVQPMSTHEQTSNHQVLPSVEQPQPASPPNSTHIRLGPNGPYIASPKRPLEDSDNESTYRSKFLRGESPLKGAAGRRLQSLAASNATANTGASTMGGHMTKNYIAGNTAVSHPPPLPGQIADLLSILPRAELYRSTAFDAARMVNFLRGIDVESARMRLGL